MRLKTVMKFSEIATFLRRIGYVDYETILNHRVFYEFGKMDFMYNDCAKKFDMDYKDGNVKKVVMTQFWFGTTSFKDIFTIEDLENSI